MSTDDEKCPTDTPTAARDHHVVEQHEGAQSLLGAFKSQGTGSGTREDDTARQLSGATKEGQLRSRADAELTKAVDAADTVMEQNPAPIDFYDLVNINNHLQSWSELTLAAEMEEGRRERIRESRLSVLSARLAADLDHRIKESIQSAFEGRICDLTVPTKARSSDDTIGNQAELTLGHLMLSAFSEDVDLDLLAEQALEEGHAQIDKVFWGKARDEPSGGIDKMFAHIRDYQSLRDLSSVLKLWKSGTGGTSNKCFPVSLIFGLKDNKWTLSSPPESSRKSVHEIRNDPGGQSDSHTVGSFYALYMNTGG